MKKHYSFFLAGICLLVSACATVDSSHQSTDLTVNPDLRAASIEWDRLYNTADLPHLAALYAPDAISMPPGSPTLQGRPALQADFQSFFAANTAHHQTFVDEITQDGDLAIERAHYRLTYKPKTGGPEVTETGRHLECRKKNNGTWQIIIEIWNQDPPPPK